MPRFIQFLLVIAILSLANVAAAQSLTAENSQPIQGGPVIPGPDDVLWDNTAINNTTAGIVSTRLASLPAGADIVNVADDFTVPAGQQWTVGFVYSEGFSNILLDVDSFEVIFYADGGGLPGAEIDRQSIPFGGAVTMTTQELTLPTPVVLTGGTYWVSVVGVYDTAPDLATGRWNWSDGPTPIDSEWFLQDLGGFFGGLPWTSATGLGIADVSALFALRGTSAAVAPPEEARAVPALDAFGLTVLGLLLALMAGLVIARRTY